MKKLWYVIFPLLLALGGYFIYKNHEVALNAIEIGRHGLWRWLFIAILAQLIVYLFIILMHQAALLTVGSKRSVKELIPLVLSTLVINVIAPTGGTAGAVLFATDASDRGESPMRVATGVILVLISDFVAFSSLLIFALAFLAGRGELGSFETIAALIFFAMTGFLVSLIYFAKAQTTLLRKILNRIKRFFDWFDAKFRKKINPEDWVPKVVCELNEASDSIVKNPRMIGKTLAYSLLSHFANIISLYFIFLAFGAPVKAGFLISGYAISALFKVVSPIPEGIGVVEATMTLVYSSFGIQPIKATAIAITFRLFNFWIPFGLGFGLLQKYNIDKILKNRVKV